MRPIYCVYKQPSYGRKVNVNWIDPYTGKRYQVFAKGGDKRTGSGGIARAEEVLGFILFLHGK